MSTWGISGVPWRDILSTMGDILSTVGDTQYRAGYHDACVCVCVWGIMSTVGGVQYSGGINLLLFEYPHGTEHPPTVLMISPHMYHDIPHAT